MTVRIPAGRCRAARDAGSAIVEFLGVALLLLVPVVYLVLVLGELQQAAFAVDGAAREAVRAWATTSAHERAALEAGELGPFASPEARAWAAVQLALADQGISAPPSALEVTCPDDCADPAAGVVVTVEVDVALPGVPAWLAGVVPLVVPVSAGATGTVDTFGGGR